MNPEYPIYVISKGRWEKRHTSKALEQRNIPYRIVIEPQEFDKYAAVIDPSKILVLPFSNLGQGSIPARNWVWDHSVEEGHEKHWILDDNIAHFYQLHCNVRYYTTSGTGFRVIEQFSDRYENLALAGMQYRMFVPSKSKQPPVILNTRIYSCILIRNDIPYRWRGRYNEDTDLSLRVLKDGWCTVLFKQFLADKLRTMTVTGGNTDELYRQNDQFDGRLEMAKALRTLHPDVTSIGRRYGRWQHVVDYRPFKKNTLRRKPGASTEPIDYGIVFKHRGEVIRPEEVRV